MSFLNTPTTHVSGPVAPGERKVTLSTTVAGRLRFFNATYIDETSISLLVRPDPDDLGYFAAGVAVGVILQQQPAPFMYMCSSTGNVTTEGVLELSRGRVCS